MAEATRGFRRALLAAAQQACAEGRLTRWELFRVRTVSALAPGKLREAQECVVDNAVAAGMMGDADGDADGFDWMALLDFIKELIPVLIQILAIF